MNITQKSKVKKITITNKSQDKNNLKKTYRKFNLWFLLATFAPMISVSLFNIFIDPYNIYKSPTFIGINQSKPEKLKNQRLFKAVDVIRIKPVTIFLGSSRTDYGLDPEHPALANDQPAYNLALGAASPYQMLNYFRHALANQADIKLVIIGLDEFMFNYLNGKGDGEFESRIGKKSLTVQDLINTTFSFDALTASRETIKANISDPEYISYTPRGRLYPRRIDENPEATNYRFNQNIGVYLNAFFRYELAQDFLKEFQEIVNICQQNKIKLKVFISPSHATRWETIRAAGHWDEYEQLKRELVKIVPIWDFSGYNSITTEPISNNMKNYIDDSHYRKEIGDLVLNRILSYKKDKVPLDFGILITPDNIESHLAKIRADRETWAKNNVKEVQLVLDIQQKLIHNQAGKQLK